MGRKPQPPAVVIGYFSDELRSSMRKNPSVIKGIDSPCELEYLSNPSRRNEDLSAWKVGHHLRVIIGNPLVFGL
jgi:hypothetical protein